MESVRQIINNGVEMDLYHYCSNSSFVEIVKSHSIWLTELTLSNDYMEGKWVREVFHQVCEDLGFKPWEIEQLLGNLDYSINYWGGLGFCMSEKPDVLSQWRGYSDDGAGVSVGFSKDYLVSIKDQFWSAPKDGLQTDESSIAIGLSEVTYDLDSQKKQLLPHAKYIMDCVKRGALHEPTLLTDNGTDEEKRDREKARNDLVKSFAAFIFILYSLKNPAFEEELESRLIAWVPKLRSDNAHNKYNKNLEVRARGNHIVPYLELKLQETEQAAINEVWLGPRNTTPETFVEAFLAKYGFPNVKVQKSSASYRR